MTAVALAWLRGVVEEQAVAAQADAVDVERIAPGPECLGASSIDTSQRVRTDPLWKYGDVAKMPSIGDAQ